MALRLPFRAPNLGPRTRKVLQIVGLAVLSLVVFVFALQATFPYDRVKDKLAESVADKYDITVGSIDRGFMPGNVTFKNVTIKTRVTAPDDIPTTFFINKLDLEAGILPLLGGTLAMDAEAAIGPGTLTASIQVGNFGKGNIDAHVVGSRLPGDTLPMRAALGLPMTGKIDFDVSLALPMEKSKLGKVAVNWQKARGNFSLGCPNGCTFGDGVTKLKPLLKNTRNQVMVGEGIDFGKVSMESLLAKATMKNGKLTLDKFDTRSKDGELKVDYTMTLEKEWGESMVAGCLRFKGSDDLLKREPKTYAAITTTGAELRNDGLFHIRLTDRFKDMKRLNQECGPGASTPSGENFSGNNDRPNLTVTEEKPAAGSANAPPPPPSPTPTPMEAPAAGSAQDANPTGAPPPTPTPTPTPANNFNDGVPATPTINSDPPRERAGQQNRIEQPVGSGGSATAPQSDGNVTAPRGDGNVTAPTATPPPE